MSAKLTSTAVMARRAEPEDSLDDFPTPPWATRALFEHVLPAIGIAPPLAPIWEPAANRGLMAEVLAEYSGRRVFCSDVHDYGYRPSSEGGRMAFSVGSFTGRGADVAAAPEVPVAAVITNPPFRMASEFFERAVAEAPLVALLLRTQWIEGEERYRRIFKLSPPSVIGFFAERAPMVKGRWDPQASTATAYAWFVWHARTAPRPPFWIPPGARRALSRDSDIDLALRLGALGGAGARRAGLFTDEEAQ